MLIFTYYKDEEIRTPEEAYEQLRRGNFSGGANFEYCAPDTLTVLSCTLEYRTDTKGFYRPVYVFRLTDYETYDAFVMVHAMKWNKRGFLFIRLRIDVSKGIDKVYYISQIEKRAKR